MKSASNSSMKPELHPEISAFAKRWLQVQGLAEDDLAAFQDHLDMGAKQVRDRLSSDHSYALRAKRVEQEDGDELAYWRALYLSEIRASLSSPIA